MWRIRPVRELLKRRNLETRLRNNSKRYSVLPSPRFSSPRFTPHHAFLGDAVNDGSRNSKEGSRDLRDVTCNSTQSRVSRMSDSRVYRRDWRQFSSVRVWVPVRNREFTLVRSESYKWSEVEEESSSPWEHLDCDWTTFFVCNIWSVRLLLLCRDPLLGND
jgi:hypothetical protein